MEDPPFVTEEGEEDSHEPIDYYNCSLEQFHAILEQWGEIPVYLATIERQKKTIMDLTMKMKGL